MSAEVAAKDLEAKVLRAEGLTYVQVGALMNERESKAYKRCNRERANESARAYKRRNRPKVKRQERRYRDRNRAACSKCGYLYGPGTTRNDGTPVVDFSKCPGCAEKRRQQILECWWTGLTIPEIADWVDATPGSVGVQIVHMRAAGYDLPYRRKVPS